MLKQAKIIVLDDPIGSGKPSWSKDQGIRNFFEETFGDRSDLVTVSSKFAEKKQILVSHNPVKIKESIMSLGDLVPDSPLITVYGHGGYHHHTYGFTALALEKIKPIGEVGYVHFDNHNDLGILEPHNYLGCGSFVLKLCKDRGMTPFLIGQYFNKTVTDIFKNAKYVVQNNSYKGEYRILPSGRLPKKFVNELSPNLYLSFDLDLLSDTQINTGYNQGIVTLPQLLTMVKQISKKHNIISADILGFTRENVYYGHETEYYDAKSLLCYSILT
ncbi:MAG: arginase family protein, partial [Nanoarchaeota archaeon]